ncbi:pre-rRNA processing [Friedmanniomyces endolithicus]|nr:pre-rRNA processing [Friedmanniomyces endolithicus]KAK0984450.1 pre-rRNA processing [Friedmanniomyces endolithicus]KAK1005825.1 pre-rRNA processing [Friedmanniomyces endolithicus]KAK1049511.1 pre-rRNA processing [Friedmanniomyces endolithicus]
MDGAALSTDRVNPESTSTSEKVSNEMTRSAGNSAGPGSCIDAPATAAVHDDNEAMASLAAVPSRAFGTYASYYKSVLLPRADNLLMNVVGGTECFVILLLSFVVGRLVDAGHIGKVLFVGTILLGVGTFSLGAVNGDAGKGDGNYGAICATQGFLTSLGMACHFVSSSQVVATWFTETKSFAVGVVACGASAGGAVISTMVRYLNQQAGFNNASRYVAIMLFVLSATTVIICRPNPEHPRGTSAKWRWSTFWDATAFRNPCFCWLSAAVFFIFLGFYPVFFNLEAWAAANGIAFRGNSRPAGIPPNAIETFALLSMMNGSSFLGRLLSAGIADHLGSYGALHVHGFVTATASILLMTFWTTANTVGKAIGFVLIFGMFSGAVIGLPPASMAFIIGKTDKLAQARLGQRVGMMYSIASLPALVGPLIAGHLITQFGTFLAVQLWSGGCLMASTACMGVCIYYERKSLPQLDDLVSGPSDSHELIDNVLRAYLTLASTHKREYLGSEYDVAKYCYRLLDAELFQGNQDYVRRQFLYCLLQDDDVDTLHLAAALLLFDGRANETAFELLQSEGAFSRIVELIRAQRDDDIGLHRLLLELLCEMSRIQKLTLEDLKVVDDAFVLYLFQLIEQLSDDADDPYHYPIIRVILVLNEQYMCFANAPVSMPGSGEKVTNRILKLISAHGPLYRTFGENLILLLNRETALAHQLLILKLLYLLFTTPATYEYFYTNDLHVLVDVVIRNLLDLDPSVGKMDEERDGQKALRHTYLRVLCPLLRNTQLAREGNNYKREEVRKLLHLLVNRSAAHFAPVDETVIRLVIRCKQIEWLKQDGDEQDEELERKLAEFAPKEADVAKKLMGMSLDDAGVSSLSVVEVAAKVTKEKPTVPAPRRRRTKPVGKATNGTHGAGLKVPPTDLSASISGSEDAREGGRSPFADDAEEV